MNRIEIDRSLRELRLPGILATLETRLLQAQVPSNPFWRPSAHCSRMSSINVGHV